VRGGRGRALALAWSTDMAGDAMERYKAAEKKLEEVKAAGDARKKALLEAREAMTALCRRGIGKGKTVPPPAAQLQAASRALEEATASVKKAVEEEQRYERELREAKARAAAENPEHFMPAKVEVPVPAEAPAAPGQALPRTSIALLFPGQGSQFVGMIKGLQDNPQVKELIATAEAVLGWDPLDVCVNGPEAKLEETSVCQPCMFLGGMAGLVSLRQTRPEAAERPGAVAGLSLGEYTALCAAGVFTFEQGMQLVKVRGQAMAEAASSTPQAMLSIFGLDQEVLEKLCQEQAYGGEVCQVANHLFPRGFACAGTADAITRLKESTENAGAMQAKLLKTSGAFHTSLMKPAQEKLQEALEKLMPEMKPPTCDIYMNVTGKKVKAGTPPADFVPLLAKQLCSPVLWENSVRLMIDDGMTEFFEVGPMRQLKAIMKRIDMNMWTSTTNVEV